MYKQVVVFDNKSNPGNNGVFSTQNNSNENEREAVFLVWILQYLETPQYLRKTLFSKHNSITNYRIIQHEQNAWQLS